MQEIDRVLVRFPSLTKSCVGHCRTIVILNTIRVEGRGISEAKVVMP